MSTRIANSFALDLLSLYRGERDFTDALILAALTPASCLPGRASETAPRPLSVNAVATSLDLPFETVRRRAKRLVAAGFCDASPDGLRISEAVLASAAHETNRQKAYRLVHDLHDRLDRADCLARLELPTATTVADDETAATVAWRASCEYFLRFMELMLPGFGSITQAFIIMEVVRMNTQDLSDDVRGRETMAPDSFVPDAFRRPARSALVAARLGLPHETTRRNLLALVEDGRMMRARGGFVVPASVLARPKMAVAVVANYRNLGRMFGELAHAGVLARWETGAKPRPALAPRRV